MEDCKPGKCGKDKACDRKTKRCKPKKPNVSHNDKDKETPCKPGKCGKDSACDRKTQRCKPKGKKATRKNTPILKSATPAVEPAPMVEDPTPIPTPSPVLTPSPEKTPPPVSPIHVGLTKDNLMKMGLRPPTPKKETPVKRKPTRIRNTPKNMSDKIFEREKSYYDIYLEDFKNAIHNEIYDFLEKIAKRKYSKYENMKEFQEEFYQNFMKIDNKYRLYYETGHKRLEKLREKTDSM